MVRFVNNEDPQSGLAASEFIDAENREHTMNHVLIFTDMLLDAKVLIHSCAQSDLGK
jgi:hypothetical protein